VSASLIDRVGTWVLAAALFAAPVAYSSNLADPFAFVKEHIDRFADEVKARITKMSG